MKFLSPLLLIASTAALTAQTALPSPSTASSSTEQREAFIAQMKQRLAINRRATDPFGLSQNLEAATLPLGGGDFGRKTPTLSELLAAVHIPLVDAEAGIFLMGSREFRTGEVFPLVHERGRLRVRVKQITQDAILFENLDSGEFFRRSMKLDPRHHIDFQDPPLPDQLRKDDSDEGRPFHLPS